MEIDADHLLLGLLQDANSTASRALVGLGVNLAEMRADILTRLTPGSAAEIAHRKTVEERCQNHPRVQALSERIGQLQAQLEAAVAALEFNRAATFRDERQATERALDELYSELDTGPTSSGP